MKVHVGFTVEVRVEHDKRERPREGAKQVELDECGECRLHHCCTNLLLPSNKLPLFISVHKKSKISGTIYYEDLPVHTSLSLSTMGGGLDCTNLNLAVPK